MQVLYFTGQRTKFTEWNTDHSIMSIRLRQSSPHGSTPRCRSPEVGSVQSHTMRFASFSSFDFFLLKHEHNHQHRDCALLDCYVRSHTHLSEM